MAEEIQREDPKVWSKYPWQKSVIVLMSAIIVLFGIIIKSARDDNEREKERVENFRALYKEQTKELKEANKELYNCKDESARYFRTQDSTNRAVLDQPARDLLKQLNR